ncbi:hypothetical protein QBZ16_002175 [Prototheca wickerhamii]|uniref:Uncharacterized protein n=1 Tax=Prototheca wickerhamii TaxID=3111 RepID=A0AAD9IM31_PROWI|nr:hypothetical protein QBZ16_002175 [Prototheca wickerhamii]
MASGVLESVVLSFTAQLVELQQATLLRVDGETSRLCKEAISDLETRLLDLETHVRHMKGLLAKERSALPAARAIAQACALRQRQLEHIQAHLPSYLPGLAQPPAAAAHATAAAPAKPAAAPPRAPGRENQAPQQAAEPTPAVYISHSELESLSSYMRARLTTDRVNAALDELHRHAQRNAALVLAARKGPGQQRG